MRDWKSLLGKIVLGAVTIFCLYQIYHALNSGEVLVPTRGKNVYVSFVAHPFWFFLVLSFHVVIVVIFSTLIYLGVRTQIRGQNVWQKRKTSPPLDNARREPVDRDL
jgi:hypothetical protein